MLWVTWGWSGVFKGMIAWCKPLGCCWGGGDRAGRSTGGELWRVFLQRAWRGASRWLAAAGGRPSRSQHVERKLWRVWLQGAWRGASRWVAAGEGTER